LTGAGPWRNPIPPPPAATRLAAIFQRLKALGDALHRDLGVTASMRARSWRPRRGRRDTVARIARAKRVSRQHPALVNALIRHGLAASARTRRTGVRR
jgi:hypothetical protein